MIFYYGCEIGMRLQRFMKMKYSRSSLVIFLALTMALTIGIIPPAWASSVASAPVQSLSVQQTVTFTINKNSYTVGAKSFAMDVSPLILSDRTLVPVRYLANALGANTTWNAATRQVTIGNGSTTVNFVIGSTSLAIDGSNSQMDVAPVIINGRTFLPARYLAQAMGYDISWNAATQTVSISPDQPGESLILPAAYDGQGEVYQGSKVGQQQYAIFLSVAPGTKIFSPADGFLTNVTAQAKNGKQIDLIFLDAYNDSDPGSAQKNGSPYIFIYSSGVQFIAASTVKKGEVIGTVTSSEPLQGVLQDMSIPQSSNFGIAYPDSTKYLTIAPPQNVLEFYAGLRQEFQNTGE